MEILPLYTWDADITLYISVKGITGQVLPIILLLFIYEYLFNWGSAEKLGSLLIM